MESGMMIKDWYKRLLTHLVAGRHVLDPIKPGVRPHVRIVPSSRVMEGWWECYTPNGIIGYGITKEVAYENWRFQYWHSIWDAYYGRRLP